MIDAISFEMFEIIHVIEIRPRFLSSQNIDIVSNQME